MKILGISCFYHDSAAALIEDGKILSAAQEERFTRKKHDPAFPSLAIKYCLESQNINPSELDAVVFYEKPFLKFERLLEMYLAFAPKGFLSFSRALPVWLREKLFQRSLLEKYLKNLYPNIPWASKLLFSEHHISHAASAFYPSPFEKAAVLTLDGVGEWKTTSLCMGNGSELTPIKDILFPHSLGLLYSAFTYYTGFKVNSGEYKLMGLAPYGIPKFTQIIYENLVDVKEDGSFRLNMDYFDYCTGLTMVNSKFEKLFGKKARKAEEEVTQFEMDIAASIQKVLEEILEKLIRFARKETGSENLCLAGGVALNCVANGKILQKEIFKNIWGQPAAGDAGGALGAALAAYHMHFKKKRIPLASDSMNGSYLGPSFSAEDIRLELTKCGAVFKELSSENLIQSCAEILNSGKALGWFQGRMEFGPRALGCRSILADARSLEMQSTLNLKVKFRESFRPFAPAVLKEDAKEWFDLPCESPYMLMVGSIKDEKRVSASNVNTSSLWGIDLLKIQRSQIPAVTHVDYSARVQTVSADTNPVFHSLLKQFKKQSSCGVLVNTSFNVRGEPIVCTPSDAFRCFMGTGIDALAVGNFLLLKENQNPDLQGDYKNEFELD